MEEIFKTKSGVTYVKEYIDSYRYPRKCKITSAKTIEELLRRSKPYTFTLIFKDGDKRRGNNADRLGPYERYLDGATLQLDEYNDCPHCRDARYYFNRNGFKSLEEVTQKHNHYWCNDCQGTGWLLESWSQFEQRMKLIDK